MISIILSFYDRDKDRINDITNHILSLSKDVELIIVDDRYDKSVSLNNKYIITPYEGNKGLVYSRYYGFIHSHGDYIWFIDADDKVLKIPELLDYDLQVFEYDNLSGMGWLYKNKKNTPVNIHDDLTALLKVKYSVAEDNKRKSNIDKYTKTDLKKFNNLISFDGGTPVTIFIKNGEEKTTATRIEGDVSTDKIIDKLKKNGFID